MDSLKVSVKKEAKNSSPKNATESASVKTSEPKKSRSGGFLGNILISVLATAIVVGGVLYLWSSQTTTDQVNKAKNELTGIKSDLENKITDLQNKVTQVETENTDLKTNNDQLKGLAGMLDLAKRTFDSPELGIKFDYPASYGDVKWTIEKGPTAGKIFSATFSANDKLILGAITKDYTLAQGGVFTDTLGFQKTGNKYYYLADSTKNKTDFQIEPLKILTADKNNILIVDKNSFVSERTETASTTVSILNPGDNSVGAIVNLKGKDFTGLAVWDKDLQALPQDKFEQILNTIQIR